jgi:hypothetical protein
VERIAMRRPYLRKSWHHPIREFHVIFLKSALPCHCAIRQACRFIVGGQYGVASQRVAAAGADGLARQL